MTTTKRKHERLADSALKRARALAHVDTRDDYAAPPPGAVPADPAQLAHNNTHARLPQFYLDKVIKCRSCGKEEVWPADRQKWWYETAKGNINTTAVYCRLCRSKDKARKAEARRVQLSGLARKHKPT